MWYDRVTYYTTHICNILRRTECNSIALCAVSSFFTPYAWRFDQYGTPCALTPWSMWYSRVTYIHVTYYVANCICIVFVFEFALPYALRLTPSAVTPCASLLLPAPVLRLDNKYYTTHTSTTLRRTECNSIALCAVSTLSYALRLTPYALCLDIWSTMIRPRYILHNTCM